MITGGRHGGVGCAANHQMLGGVIIVIEVRMGEIDAVVIDTDRDARARVVVPNCRDIDIDASGAAGLPGIPEVPLRRN